MKKSGIKTTPLLILIMLVLSVNVFALDEGIKSYPIETDPIGDSDTLGFMGVDGNGIIHSYNVKVTYNGKVDFNPNTMKDTIYNHHMYALGYIGNGNPFVNLLKLVVYQNGSIEGTTTSFSYCQRDHIWPSNQRLYFDDTASTSFTVEHSSGRIQIVVLIYENDVSFLSPTGSINVYL